MYGAATNSGYAESATEVWKFYICALAAGFSEDLDPLVDRFEIIHVVVNFLAVQNDRRGAGLFFNARHLQVFRSNWGPIGCEQVRCKEEWENRKN